MSSAATSTTPATDGSSASPSTTTEDTAAAGDSSSEPSSSDGPKPTATVSKDTSVTLGQAALHDDGWSDGQYNVAGRDGITGMGAPVSTCTQPDQQFATDYGTNVEFRINDKYDTLTFSVGPDTGGISAVTTDELHVEVLGDGDDVLWVKDVEYNKSLPASINVKDKAAIKIRLTKRNQKTDCDSSKSIVGVLYNMKFS